jgi:citrate/tricarballylate utilization protein
MPPTDFLPPDSQIEVYAEARRDMEICNACRYCEGYCAVFPAMELRRAFTDGDLDYLANLCHDCRGCYHACQYAPPHPWGLNLPRALADLRAETYAEHVWPPALARAFATNGTVVSAALASAISLLLAACFILVPADVLLRPHAGPGAVYDVIPWAVMSALAVATLLFAVFALWRSVQNFWRATGGGTPNFADWRHAAGDVLTLRNLGGGGHGCNDRDERFSTIRRWFHHAMFCGFALCFASTCAATFFADVLGEPAPYPFLSVPVQLGTVGGVLMLIGVAGFFWLRVTADPGPVLPRLLGGQMALLMLLKTVAGTGLLLLALRATPAMGVLLAIHLGAVFALFALLPYSRMIHGPFRAAALLRDAMERRAKK